METDRKTTWADFTEACKRLHEACGRVRETLNDMEARRHAEAAAKLIPLRDEDIDALAEGMPGGMDGFLKGWGWRQFARAVEQKHGIEG